MWTGGCNLTFTRRLITFCCLVLHTAEMSIRGFSNSKLSLSVKIAGVEGNLGSSTERGNWGASGRSLAYASCEYGGTEPFFERVTARLIAPILDDGFGMEAEPGIVPLDLMECWGPWSPNSGDQMTHNFVL